MPFKYKIVGEVLILIALIALLVFAVAFPLDAKTISIQLVLSIFTLLCYAGVFFLVFSKERVENEAVMHLRVLSIVVVAAVYCIGSVILEICSIWVQGSVSDFYFSFIRTLPFIYYLLFRILYRKRK